MAALDWEWDSYDHLVPDREQRPLPTIPQGEDEEQRMTIPEMLEQKRIEEVANDPRHLQFEMDIGIDEAIDEKFRSLDEDLDKIMLAFEKG